MLTLYDYAPSQNAWKVRALLALLKQPYRTVWVDLFGTRDAAFLAANPLGAVPVLIDECGRSLPESNAILCHLARGTRYRPDDSWIEAEILRWLCFEQDYVQSTVATLRFWVQTGRFAANADAAEGKRVRALQILDVLDRHLAGRPMLAGDRLTIADIAVYAYVHRAEEADLGLEPFRALRRWINAFGEAAAPLPPHHPYAVDPKVMVARA